MFYQLLGVSSSEIGPNWQYT